MLTSRVGQRWIFRSDAGYLGQERVTDCSVIAASVAFLLLGVAAVAQWLFVLGEGYAVGAWPTTIGNVVSLQVEEVERRGRPCWLPHVRYAYSVAGRSMINTTITLGDPPCWKDYADAVAFLGRYGGDGSVQVYYNPRNASDATLEPRQGTREYHVLVLGLVLIFAALACLAVYDVFGSAKPE